MWYSHTWFQEEVKNKPGVERRDQQARWRRGKRAQVLRGWNFGRHKERMRLQIWAEQVPSGTWWKGCWIAPWRLRCAGEVDFSQQAQGPPKRIPEPGIYHLHNTWCLRKASRCPKACWGILFYISRQLFYKKLKLGSQSQV